MYTTRNKTKILLPTDLNGILNPRGRSNSLYHYRPIANQKYSSRISLDPEGERKLHLKYQKNPGHIFNVFYKTNFLEENKSLRANERADLQSEMNTHLKKQKYQILLEKDFLIQNVCDRKNNEIKTEFNERKMKIKNKLIQIIRESLIFAKNNSPVGAMLQSNVQDFLERIKTEPDNSIISLSLESTKENNEKTKHDNSKKNKKNKKKQKNEFLRLIGVDVENLSLNNINLDIDKAWNYILKLGKGRNIEEILRMKVANSIMSLTEQNAALKVKHINQKYEKYKDNKNKEKMEILKKKREEEEKKLEEFRKMDPREIIKEKIKESLGQKSNLRKYSQSMDLMNKKRQKENKVKKRIELDSYKDVDQILDIIKNSGKDSKNRLFLEHYINIRRRKSIDLRKEKAWEKNKFVEEKK